MQGPLSTNRKTPTPEEVYAKIPEDIKQLRQLCLAVFGNGTKGQELLAALKQYYIMKTPVALPHFTKKYAFFREGQNSLLRSIETFCAEESDFLMWMSSQLNAGVN